jgi:hypothetical protein
MSYKDLGNKDASPRVETPEEAEMRARAAARHKAKEARREEHRAAGKKEHQGGAIRRDPHEE